MLQPLSSTRRILPLRPSGLKVWFWKRTLSKRVESPRKLQALYWYPASILIKRAQRQRPIFTIWQTRTYRELHWRLGAMLLENGTSSAPVPRNRCGYKSQQEPILREEGSIPQQVFAYYCRHSSFFFFFCFQSGRITGSGRLTLTLAIWAACCTISN